jgi:hypothetical protein
MGPRTAWYARANSDHSRDAVPDSVAFCETTPIQGTVSDCRHPLGLGSCRVCPLERRRISHRITARPERFVQTSLRERAYARAYGSSDERAAEPPRWLHSYNWHRPHGRIGSKPTITRLALGPSGRT